MAEKVTIGSADIYLGDCRDVLQFVAKDAAIVSDPPYGIGYAHGGHGPAKKATAATKRGNRPIFGDDAPFDPQFWTERFSNVLLFGADHFYPRLPDRGRFLAWNKLGPFPPMGDCFSDVEFAWHSGEKTARIFSHLWKGFSFSQQGERDGLVNGRASRLHPTQKPVQLMAWCIEQAGCPALVFDPYMGSGTTGVAALEMGLKFIGCEIDRQYFDIACKRLERANSQEALALVPTEPASERDAHTVDLFSDTP